jgi:teichuronic acid biosynthesis protein TuaE
MTISISKNWALSSVSLLFLFLIIGFTPDIVFSQTINVAQKIFTLIIVIIIGVVWGIEKKTIYPFIFFICICIFSYLLKNENHYSVETKNFISSFISMSTMYLIWMVNLNPIKDVLAKVMGNLPILAVGIFTIVSILIGIPLIKHEYTGAYRLAGLLHPAHLAMLLFYAIAFLVYISLRENRPYWFKIGILFVLLLLTGTRGPMIATLIIMLPLIKFYKKKYTVFVLVISIIPLSYILYEIISNLMLRNASTYKESFNTSGRFEAWIFFLRSVPDSNFFGNGLGSVLNVTKGIAKNNLEAFHTPHNEFIRFYIDLGWVGAIFFFLNLFYILFISLRNSIKKAIPSIRFFVFLFLVAFFVYTFVDNTLSTPQSTIPLILFLKYIYYEFNK